MPPARGLSVNLAADFHKRTLVPPVKQAPYAAHAPRGSLVAHDWRPMEDTERHTYPKHDA